MVKQYPISLQIPVIEGKTKDLENALKAKGPTNPLIADSPLLSSWQGMKNVHFARFMIAPAVTLQTGEKVGASLIYSANVDGDPKAHLKELSATVTDQLKSILVNCQGFAGNDSPDQIYNYMLGYKLKTPAFYVGAPNRSVQQIQEEAKFQFDLQNFVKKNEGKWQSTESAFEAIKAWINSPENKDKWSELRKKYHLPRKSWIKLLFLGLFLLSILPFVVLFVLIVQFIIEPKYKPFGLNINQLPTDHLDKMMDVEDIVYQNQLSQVFETKRGLRGLGLRFFLWQTNMLGKWVFVDGQLLGTPTIHFARWVIIDNGKRFVFFSNFDGSYDMYLGDFVDNSGWGLNTIYGASKGYPKTLLVFLKGAYKIGEFMGWGRKTQVETQFWYSAYPWEGLQQIVSRSQLRTALFNKKNLSDKEKAEALRRI